MNAIELISFIPLLLYGISLAELFSQWRRFFEKQYLYWPYVISTVVFIEVAIWNIYLFFYMSKEDSELNYFEYWVFLLQPIMFLLMVHAFTPEREEKNTEVYFKKRMPVVFGIMALYIASHSIPSLDTIDIAEYARAEYARIASVVICLAIAISRKVFLVYIMGVLWLITLFIRF